MRLIQVTELKIDEKVPTIVETYTPYEDKEGMWIDFKIEYNGETKALIKAHGIDEHPGGYFGSKRLDSGSSNEW